MERAMDRADAAERVGPMGGSDGGEERVRPNTTLRALTSGALALPGLALPSVSNAAAPIDRANADYRYSFYSEDALSDAETQGTNQRFEVDIHQFHIETPVLSRGDFTLDVIYETMTGASPSYVVPTAQGPSNVMTGASIEDERVDLLGHGTYYFDNTRAGLAAGYSFEKDYESWNASIDVARDFFNKATTVSFATGFSYDLVNPVDGGNIAGEKPKSSNSASLGITQIIDRYTAIQTNATYQNQRGFLSHAYKQIQFTSNGVIIPDSRPRGRNQFTWLTQLRRHFTLLEGSFHADYRLYADDWGILSHTVEAAWFQTFFDTIQFIPSFRYYTQSQADFYSAVHTTTRADGFYTSDYRLSPYGAISWKLKAATTFEINDIDWAASLSWERYVSDIDYALGSVDVENPGLVSFNLISFGLTGRF